MIRFSGKDHRCSIEAREQFGRECAALRRGPHVYLQTCNRVEVYSGDGTVSREIAGHLFRVTAGLESRLVGERHIQGQVKRAYLEAIERRSMSPGLHRLFQRALCVGKLVRCTTGISAGAVSYSQATVELLRREAGTLRGTRAVVVGVNRTTEALIRYLMQEGCGQVTIVNRTIEKAREAASALGCAAAGIVGLAEAVALADVVVSATAAAEPVIVPSHIRDRHPMIIVDLAVPRDVDVLVGWLPGVTLFDINDVEQGIDQNLAARMGELDRAKSIIDTEADAFCGIRSEAAA
jgi:glutamyl-tRNA reductase